MEAKEKNVKVYSNNSKKARLKRNKNKFQRVWDAEKQKYVKIRKAKYALHIIKVEKTIKTVDEQVKAAFARASRRNKAKKIKKSAPVNAQQMETKISKLQKTEKKIAAKQIHAKISDQATKTINMGGNKLVWDQKSLRYYKAA